MVGIGYASQPGLLKTSSEEVRLALVAHPGQLDVPPCGTEQCQEPPNVRRSTHRHDGDALVAQVPSASDRQGLERIVVTQSLDEHDRACVVRDRLLLEV